MRGRKPKPTSTRKLGGNAGRRPLNDAEPVPPELADDLPLELVGNVRAIAEWQRLVPMLQKIRLITQGDRAAIVALCLEWARYLDASARVETMVLRLTATGYPLINPYLSIASKALAHCQKLWPELGLTPSSRSRIQVDGPGPEGDVFSEFDEPIASTKGMH